MNVEGAQRSEEGACGRCELRGAGRREDGWRAGNTVVGV